MIRARGLTKAFGNHQVLDHIDLTIGSGERVAVMGASGAGKSTLAAAILRLHDPCEGRVLIDGEDLRSFTLRSLRRQVSIVLQDTLLFAGSLRDNIAFGAPGAELPEIEAAARLANAHEFIEELPEGYETAVGERGLDLSAGQRQRIAIARAFISRPPIAILDEPLAGLDEENARIVGEALKRLTEGRTTFLITHDLLHAARCDRILVLQGARIAENGTHAELQGRGGPYSAMYRAWLATRRDAGEVQADVLAG